MASPERDATLDGAIAAEGEANRGAEAKTLAAVIRRVQANVRCYISEGADLAADLSEDRRREAADDRHGEG
jgi:hypothetical protein